MVAAVIVVAAVVVVVDARLASSNCMSSCSC